MNLRFPFHKPARETARDRQIADWLRATAAGPPGASAEDPGPGLNAMVLDVIRRETTMESAPRSSAAQYPQEPTPGLLRMAWAGALLLAFAAAWLLAILPYRMELEPSYFASVRPNRIAAPHLSAVPVETPDHALTVLWIDGLERVPERRRIR